MGWIRTTLAVALAAGSTLMLFGSAKAQEVRRDLVCGAPVMSKDAHEHPPEWGGCRQLASDPKWCFRPVDLTVNTDNHRWVFVGEPFVTCIEDNLGSCGWNKLPFGASERLQLHVSKNPTEKSGVAFIGSRSIKVALCAEAAYYP